jgi:hypothetical protein
VIASLRDLVFVALLAAACTGGTGPAPSGASAPPTPGGGVDVTFKPGAPVEPPPSSPHQAGPSDAQAPAGMNVHFATEPGTSVRVSGEIVYQGRSSGPIETGVLHLDFLKSSSNKKFPVLLHDVVLPTLGAWEVDVPKDAGRLAVVAFIDKNDNGPEQAEPTGNALLEVAQTPVSGLRIELFDDPTRVGTPPGVENLEELEKDDAGGPEGPPPKPPAAGGGDRPASP